MSEPCDPNGCLGSKKPKKGPRDQHEKKSPTAPQKKNFPFRQLFLFETSAGSRHQSFEVFRKRRADEFGGDFSTGGRSRQSTLVISFDIRVRSTGGLDGLDGRSSFSEGLSDGVIYKFPRKTQLPVLAKGACSHGRQKFTYII